MDYAEATQLLGALTPAQRNTLEEAHDRYYCFAGISSFDAESDRQAEADRGTFAHLLFPPGPGGIPSISQERAAEFMAAVTGFPVAWCRAWDEYSFCELHGVDYAEQATMNGGVL
ncbi:hypothetical protein [Azohydromonas lata]|uniref:Uncharacterized protein n=1 Tax=Azohydromonas lata TaxID=45677 RepID=A0ABU5IK86_9BURK|nr:hypothetical protein [Azohydromonas lata]MDZ5459309.1 hypothetical protein [Azohydromonas lata]